MVHVLRGSLSLLKVFIRPPEKKTGATRLEPFVHESLSREFGAERLMAERLVDKSCGSRA